MRGRARDKLIIVGKWILVSSVAVTGVGALVGGRLGWTNYWGGFVFAPFAIVVALLAIFVLRGERARASQRR